MPSPKYPLECVLQLRDAKVEEAARELTAAVRARQDAERSRIAAERRRDHHEASTRCVMDAELDALSRGELRVADLRRTQEWASGVGAEGRRLRIEAEHARGVETRTGQAEDSARAHLASCTGQAEVIARNRAEWQRGRRKTVEAREEEASLEAWRPKK
jgi:hypothetical protein